MIDAPKIIERSDPLRGGPDRLIAAARAIRDQRHFFRLHAVTDPLLDALVSALDEAGEAAPADTPAVRRVVEELGKVRSGVGP